METDKQDVVSNNALDEEGDEEDCNKSEVRKSDSQNVIFLKVLGPFTTGNTKLHKIMVVQSFP